MAAKPTCPNRIPFPFPIAKELSFFSAYRAQRRFDIFSRAPCVYYRVERTQVHASDAPMVPTAAANRRCRTKRLAFGGVCALVLACWPAWAAKPPEPRRIPLAPLGFENVSKRFLAEGSSLLTVHFTDDSHVLVSFAVHRLLPRLASCPPGDQDHMIAAVLVDLRTSAVVARTEWRVHDHGQYLWSLGHGIFLLRSGDRLSTFAPVFNLEHGQPFLTRSLLATDRAIRALVLSHDRGLLTLETTERVSPDDKTPAEQRSARPMQLNFLRVQLPASGSYSVRLLAAGVARAHTGVVLPNDSTGYVSAVDQGGGRWAFDFHEYSGKTHELALFDSSCAPLATLVSPSEFVALACHGGTDRQLLAAFNLAGDEMWQQQFYRTYAFPVFAYAESVGRFALSRMITNISTAAASLGPEQIDAQTITVYQIDSGKQLLNVDVTPVAKSGGNFALSEDGLRLAVLRDGVLEIYPLPEPSGKDREAMKRAVAMAPPAYNGPVRMTALTTSASVEPAAAPGFAAATPAPAPAPQRRTPSAAVETSTEATAKPAAADAVAASPARPRAEGDPDPDDPTPRKRPTLYTTPGEGAPAAVPTPQ